MKNAPGCFGSPTAITPGEAECAECQSAAECLVSARTMLVAIEDDLGVGVLKGVWRKLSTDTGSVKTKPEPAAGEKDRVSSGLPKKAQALVANLVRRNLDADALAKLKSGVNPFEKNPPAFLIVVGDQLLAGGFTKPGLREVLVTRLTWGEATAGSHVSFTVPALMHLNLIHEAGGRFVINQEG